MTDGVPSQPALSLDGGIESMMHVIGGSGVSNGFGSSLYGSSGVIADYPVGTHGFDTLNTERVSGVRQSMTQLLVGTGAVSSLTPPTFGDNAGGFGSFQSLLHSFTSRVPAEVHVGSEMNSVFPACGHDMGHSRDDFDAGAAADIVVSPKHHHIDESGYASSESSVYDVASDDEFFWGDVPAGDEKEDGMQQKFTGSHTSPDSNRHPCNVSEEMPSDIGGHAPAECHDLEDCPCLDGKPFMHVMTDLAEGDSEAQPWKKRNRSKPGQDRDNCRLAKGMSPIEIALRNAPHRKTKYIFEPVLGITFDSEPEAYDFYNMYSWEVGFGVKRDTLISNGEGFQTRRDLRCLCAGAPKEGQNKSKKTGCKVRIKARRKRRGAIKEEEGRPTLWCL